MNSLKASVFGLLALSVTLAAQSSNSVFPLPPSGASTVPSNGDVNPYGVVIVPKTLPAGGGLQPGDVLISNFNNNLNLQGLGTTIVRVDAYGNVTTFYTAPNGMRGLTAALGILSNGWVLIGNMPTSDGTSATAQAGNLSILDRTGKSLGTIGTLASINGPWGMAVDDLGTNGTGTAHVFISNVLSGEVSRFDITYSPAGSSSVVITLATGFNHRPDPAALELGPSGLVYYAVTDTLYVASSADNAIYAIPTATKATTTVAQTLLFQDLTHLHGPLDLALLPNGFFLVANSDGSNVDPNQPSELVEYTSEGHFLGQMPIDPNNGGAFGVATLNLTGNTERIAAVDDNTNMVKFWTTVVP